MGSNTGIRCNTSVRCGTLYSRAVTKVSSNCVSGKRVPRDLYMSAAGKRAGSYEKFSPGGLAHMRESANGSD